MRICLALAMMFVATVATAQDQSTTRLPSAAKSPTLVTDIALLEGGVLKGQLLSTTGAPQAKSNVALVQNGKVLAVTKTDASGKFVARGMKAGVYQIETAQAGGVYRVWAPNTAPPSAKSGVLLIGNGDVVRGNGSNYGPAIRGAVAGGLLTGGVYWALDHNDEGS